MRILYVEDEKYLAEAVIHLLKKAQISVDWASDGEEGLSLAQSHDYDCLVLDIMLPKVSGLDLLQTLRRAGCQTPIIMLSALSEVDDKIKGLDFGADDYLAKPFKTAELIARLRALIRRPPIRQSRILKYSDLIYDCDTHTLNTLPLTSKESAILELLIRHPDKIYPKSTLFSYAWGHDTLPNDSYVEVYISYLRQKFKKLQSRAKIVSVRGLGYKLTERH